jgi:hypothetical protein
MMSLSYPIEQCIRMLSVLGKTKMPVTAHGQWPEPIQIQYGDCEFFFNNHGTLLFRKALRDYVTFWGGPVPITDFWMKKISQSLSFECAKFAWSMSKRTGIKDIGHLLCKFHNFKYIPSNSGVK